MHSKEAERFDNAASALGRAVCSLLCAVCERDKASTREIRLRIGSPVVLSLPSGLCVLDTPIITRDLMDSAVLNLCGHSIYSHQHELAAGYISLPGGHRAGVCGTAVLERESVSSVRDITSICLRIARHHSGCADRIIEGMFGTGVCSGIIAGAPGSGKTTVLRDMAEAMASGRHGRRLSVAVIDERGEIALSQTVGLTSRCDVLSGYPKHVGIKQSIRCLSPDVIICDEVGCRADIDAVAAGLNAGVHIICSVHVGSVRELAVNSVIRQLMKYDSFRKITLLAGRDKPGQAEVILNAEDVHGLDFCGADDCMLGAYRAAAV